MSFWINIFVIRLNYIDFHNSLILEFLNYFANLPFLIIKKIRTGCVSFLTKCFCLVFGCKTGDIAGFVITAVFYNDKYCHFLIRFNIPVRCVVQDEGREQHLDVIYFATRAGVGLHGLQVLHAVARLLQ